MKSFSSDEKLFRAVPKQHPNMWKNGTVTSAVFKDSKGVSVDRQWKRTAKEAVRVLLAARCGEYGVVSVTKGDCDNVDAKCLYAPTKDNPYHSEIHGGAERTTLTASQAKQLARCVVVEDSRGV